MLWRILFATSLVMIAGSVVAIAASLDGGSGFPVTASADEGQAGSPGDGASVTFRTVPRLQLPGDDSSEDEAAGPPIVLAPKSLTEGEEPVVVEEPSGSRDDEEVTESPSPEETAEPTPETTASAQETAEPTPTEAPPSPPSPSASAEAASASTPSPVPTPTSNPAAPPAAGEAVEIWVGGDSMAYTVGVALERAGADDPAFDALLDNRGSTGLVRPDFFDWPAYLRDVVVGGGYDVGVFMVGANDGQHVAGFAPGTDGWRAEYRARAAAAMDLFEGRLLVWVGQPPMQSQGFSATMAEVNAIFASEAAARPWVVYIDSWALLGGGDGAFRSQITLGDGTSLTVREPDGIHLTGAGGRVIAQAVLAAVNAAR